jgi:hypothetical protein
MGADHCIYMGNFGIFLTLAMTPSPEIPWFEMKSIEKALIIATN